MMNISNNKLKNSQIIIFILKLWILTNLISALIIQFFDSENYRNEFNYEYFFGGLLVFIIFGLFSSFPGLAILGILVKKVTNNKYILSLISILLVFISFLLADFNYIKYKHQLLYPIIYSIVMVALIWLIKINKKNIA